MKRRAYRYYIGILLGMSALSSGCNHAGSKASADSAAGVSHAPFYLSLDEVAAWTEGGRMTEPDNVSTVPLAKRFVDAQSQLDPSLPADAKVLIAPDGIGNYANYLAEQPKFNKYTFTHWAFVDSINWFGGTAQSNVSIPSRPWVEAAHRNGVKVLGTVFFAPKAWGGTEEEPVVLLRREADGSFIYARKLVEIAKYYGFDGWLMNQETDLIDAGPEHGEDYLAFMSELTALSPAEMEIHWYDSMLPNGKVAWQNELNDRNVRFLQDNERRTADAMFVNYWWDRKRVDTSVATAKAVSRSPFDVYTGADLWPGRNAQDLLHAPGWLDALAGEHGGPVTSIAMFANNYDFLFTGSEKQPAASMFATDESDVAAYYRSGRRLFGGDDGNVAMRDPAGSWPGIGSRIPARSTLNQLPFSTNFSTGHGRIKARQGVAIDQSWHDMAAQDILPTWQFAVQGDVAAIAETTVDFDFEQAFEKGNSVRIVSRPVAGSVSIPLYKTAFDMNTPLTVEVVHGLMTKYAGASLWLETALGQRHQLLLKHTAEGWLQSSLSIDVVDDDRIVRIGIDLAADSAAQVTLHLGELVVRQSGDL